MYNQRPPVPYYAQAPIDPVLQQQQRAYKKRLFGVGNRLGAGLLFLLVIGQVVVAILENVSEQVFPGIVNSGFFYSTIEYVVYATVSMGLAFFLVALMGRQSIFSLIPFEKCSFLLGFSCVMFAFAGIWVGNFVAGVISSLLPQVEESYQLVAGPQPNTYLQLALDLLQTAAIPALAEEFAFRGVVLGILRPYGDKFAIIISSVLFAVVHGNFVQIPFAFCTGVMLAYCVVRTNNLWPAVLVHFINNAYSVLVTFFADDLSTFATFILAYMWLIFGGIGVMLLLVTKQGVFSGFRPYAGCITPAKRTCMIIFSPAFVVSCLVYLWTAVQLILKTMVPS